MSGFTVKRNSGLFIGDVDIAPASGTIEITENGEHNVARYATADVNVESDNSFVKALITRQDNYTPVVISPIARFTLPDDIDIIGSYAFAGFSNLQKVDMTNLNKLIGVEEGAFIYSGLTSITFPSIEKITLNSSVGNSCFMRCPLSEIDLRGFRSIGASCFEQSSCRTVYLSKRFSVAGNSCFGSSAITDIYYEGTETEWNNISGISNAGIGQNVTIHYNYTGE